ncbi:MAG: AraC family transcriptional regulator ligand-binding domain-containing protein [Pseudomonadales bacterium]
MTHWQVHLRNLLLPPHKFHRLLDYVQMIGLDPQELAQRARFNLNVLSTPDAEQGIPGVYYSLIYREAVQEMQKKHTAIPWAGGIGTDSFRFMAYSIITCKTLGDALQRAQEYYRFVYPLTAHRIELVREKPSAKLRYYINTEGMQAVFAPKHWDRSEHFEAVAKSSGIRTWYSFCGWLIGRQIESEQASVAAPFVNTLYQESLEKLFGCTLEFDAAETALIFPDDYLAYRLVHTENSLEQFLQHVLYQFWDGEEGRTSTSMAIKSILGRDFREGMPSFEAIADTLHMSSSALRRRLMKENTSYQELKNESRRAAAIDYLRNDDLKIQEVVELLGFAEPSSFVKSFRSWTGMTPSAYRESAQSFTL